MSKQHLGTIILTAALVLTALAAQENERPIETWYYYLQSESPAPLARWSQDFRQAAEELQGVVRLEAYAQNLEAFISGKAPDGFYAYYIFTRNNRLLKVMYFQASAGHKYLISYLQEAVSGNNPGVFAFRTFRRTYPVKLQVNQGSARGSSEQGIFELQPYFNQDYLLGKTPQARKINVAYIDDDAEEVGFQESEITDGVYRRAWPDAHGKISLARSLKLPPDSEDFLVYYYYGASTTIPQPLTPCTIDEFAQFSFRRTLPLMLILVHKKGFYKALALSTYVPFYGDKISGDAKALYLYPDSLSFVRGAECERAGNQEHRPGKTPGQDSSQAGHLRRQRDQKSASGRR